MSFEYLREDSYGSENESRWHDLVDFLCLVLERQAITANDFSIASERFDPFVVECTITRRGALSRATAMIICEKLKECLQGFEDGWQFRFTLCDMGDPASEMVTWLEVDGFRVNEYLGRVFEERCRSMDEFESRFL